MVSVLLMLACGLAQVHAQDAIPAAGGDASGNGGSVSYSIGQTVYNTYSDGTNSVAQGVQQPYEITITTGLDQAEGISLECKAYPNPTTDVLILSVDAYNNQELSYQLYDMSGKLLQKNDVTNAKTTISMRDYERATYFLVVMDFIGEMRTFKIIKH